MAQGRIGFDRGEQRNQKRQLRGGLTPLTVTPSINGADVRTREDLLDAIALRHRRRLLLTQVQTGVALLTVTLLPPDAPGLNCQRIMRTVGNTVAAVVAAPYRPRVVAGFAAQVTAWRNNAGRLPGPSTQEKDMT